jgi:hypothetical protein
MHAHRQFDLPLAETLRDLLAALSLWQDERDRRAFLDFAFHGTRPLPTSGMTAGRSRSPASLPTVCMPTARPTALRLCRAAARRQRCIRLR